MLTNHMRTDADRLSVSLHVRACAGGLGKPVRICTQTWWPVCA
jgi:hypothetical protein